MEPTKRLTLKPQKGLIMALTLPSPVHRAARRLFGGSALASVSPGTSAPVGTPANPAPSKPTTSGNAYVCNVLLPEVGDLARPDDVWEEKHWGQRSGIKAVVEQLGYRQGSRHWVSASVELVLPAQTVQHDRRLGGQLASTLAQALTELHNRDFRHRLPDGLQTARYTVRDAADLAPGHARIRLGPAIHVRHEGEASAWAIEVSTDGLIWRTTAELAEQQRLFILAATETLGTLALPEWPFSHDSSLVILNHPGEAELEFSAEPLDSLRVSYRSDLGCHQVQPPDAGPDAPRLYLKATRLKALTIPTEPVQHPHALAAATAPRRDPVLGSPDSPVPPVPTAPPVPDDDIPTLVHRNPEPAGDNAPTLYGSTKAAAPASALILEGLALQRPSAFAGAGVRAVQWAVDAQGAVVPSDAPSGQLRFTVSEDDTVRVSTAAGTREVRAGDALPCGDQVLRLEALPRELMRAYLGWLKLPLGRAVRLPEGNTVCVGRQLQTLKPLRPLAGPGFLAGPSDAPPLSGDRMGLSRQHLELCDSPDGLTVRTLGQATTAHLDANMNFLGMLDANHPALLQAGHCLVIGHYVWRYKAAQDI